MMNTFSEELKTVMMAQQWGFRHNDQQIYNLPTHNVSQCYQPVPDACICWRFSDL